MHGPAQLLGLQHAGLLLRGAALCRGRRGGQRGARRVPSHGAQAARGGHRGDPRRGLQPHGRDRRVRPHAQLARAGQRQLLPAARRRPPALREPYRLRQHARPEPPAGAADGDGQPALLGAGDACRRLPLRPGHGAGPRAPRLRPPRGLFRLHRAGPGAATCEADRRALGHRPGRLSGGPVPDGLGGMERPLPRHHARLLAGR